MGGHSSAQPALRAVAALSCVLLCALQADAGSEDAFHSSKSGLNQLSQHVAAADDLVKQFQLPYKLPLHPSAIVGTDPLRLLEGAKTIPAAEAFCSRRIGRQFLQTWNATQKQFCKGSSASSSSSGVTCYEAPEHVSGRPLTACIATNLVLTDTGALMGRKTLEEYSIPPSDILLREFLYKLPRPKAGAVKVACEAASVDKTAHVVSDTTANGSAGYVMVDHVAQWLVAGLQDKQYKAVQQACGSKGSSVVEHAVLFLSRVGTTNFFHAVEDMLVALAFLAAHNDVVADGKLQVVFTDQDPPHPFMLEELWRHVSTAGPVRYLRAEPYPPNTCFRKAIIAPPGFTSSILSLSVDRQLLCRSALAIGLSSWLRNTTGQVTPARHPPTTFAVKAPALSAPCSQPYNGTVQRLKILFLARHKWYTSVASSHNLTAYEEWQLVRDLHNEEELIDTVKETAHAWNKGVCAYQQASTGQQRPGCRHARVTFDVAVHEHHHHHRLPRQLEDSIGASIIVGVHGAGLTHVLFMPPGGAVLEIMPAPGNSHYLNLANMMGHGYARSDYAISERRADAAEVKAKLLALMGKFGACRDNGGVAHAEDA